MKEKIDAKINKKIETIKNFYEKLKAELEKDLDWNTFRDSIEKKALNSEDWASQDGANKWIPHLTKEMKNKFSNAYDGTLETSSGLKKWYKNLNGEIDAYFVRQFKNLYGAPVTTSFKWIYKDDDKVQHFTSGNLYHMLTDDDTFDDYISKPFKKTFDKKKSGYAKARDDAADELVKYYNKTLKIVTNSMNGIIKTLESRESSTTEKRK